MPFLVNKFHGQFTDRLRLMLQRNRDDVIPQGF
jgi:hypothetical protein